VISLFHNSTTARHPGFLKTKNAIQQNFWWPNITTDIKAYIKGCSTCQSTKPRTNQPKPPSDPITPEHALLPFGMITLDFIMKLPASKGYNTILMITNHDCLKAALFFLCKETITAKEVAHLYGTYVFPHYSIPRKVISD
jgi:hypothetical protein